MSVRMVPCTACHTEHAAGPTLDAATFVCEKCSGFDWDLDLRGPTCGAAAPTATEEPHMPQKLPEMSSEMWDELTTRCAARKGNCELGMSMAGQVRDEKAQAWLNMRQDQYAAFLDIAVKLYERTLPGLHPINEKPLAMKMLMWATYGHMILCDVHGVDCALQDAASPQFWAIAVVKQIASFRPDHGPAGEFVISVNERSLRMSVAQPPGPEAWSMDAIKAEMDKYAADAVVFGREKQGAGNATKVGGRGMKGAAKLLEDRSKSTAAFYSLGDEAARRKKLAYLHRLLCSVGAGYLTGQPGYQQFDTTNRGLIAVVRDDQLPSRPVRIRSAEHMQLVPSHLIPHGEELPSQGKQRLTPSSGSAMHRGELLGGAGSDSEEEGEEEEEEAPAPAPALPPPPPPSTATPSNRRTDFMFDSDEEETPAPAPAPPPPPPKPVSSKKSRGGKRKAIAPPTGTCECCGKRGRQVYLMRSSMQMFCEDCKTQADAAGAAATAPPEPDAEQMDEDDWEPAVEAGASSIRPFSAPPAVQNDDGWGGGDLERAMEQDEQMAAAIMDSMLPVGAPAAAAPKRRGNGRPKDPRKGYIPVAERRSGQAMSKRGFGPEICMQAMRDGKEHKQKEKERQERKAAKEAAHKAGVEQRKAQAEQKRDAKQTEAEQKRAKREEQRKDNAEYRQLERNMVLAERAQRTQDGDKTARRVQPGPLIDGKQTVYYKPPRPSAPRKSNKATRATCFKCSTVHTLEFNPEFDCNTPFYCEEVGKACRPATL